MSQSSVIFLTGLGRSGTSLLQGMLNAHGKISFPPETHFFKRHILPYLLKGKLPFLDSLRDDPYLKRLRSEIFGKLHEDEILNIEDLKQALLFIMEDGKYQYIGDKDTEYVRYLPHLKELYPDAYLVHIKRDPRDVVLSRLKTKWGSKRSLTFHAAEYEYYIKEIVSLGPRLFMNRYIEIRYEDLLNEPQKQLTNVLTKLGLGFDESMLEFYKNSQSLVGSDESEWKKNLSKPMIRANTDKWRSELSPKQIAIIQSGLESFFKSSGYEWVDENALLVDRIRKKLIKLMFLAKTKNEMINLKYLK